MPDFLVARPMASLLLKLLLTASMALAGPGPGATDPSRAPGKRRFGKPVVEGKVGRQLDEVVAALDPALGGFFGSVLVAKKGKPLLYKSYGLARAADETPLPVDALWDWASVTKQFTAVAILRLEMERKLTIDDSIRKYYPEAPADKQPVTLRHLLNHTSGIKGGFDDAGGIDFTQRDATIRAYLKGPLKSPPGEKWAYSNLAYGTLAAVIEKVTGKRFEDWVTKNVFRRAGLEEACFIGMRELDLTRVPLDDRGRGVPFAYGDRYTWGYRGSGGAVLPAAEMLLWDRALRGRKLLDGRAKERLYQTSLNDYALGWFVKQRRGDTCYYHSGKVGKTVTYYLRLKDADVVVALAYSYDPAVHPEETAHKLAQIARARS